MKKNLQFHRVVSLRNIILALTLLVTCGLYSTDVFAANPDYTGKWKLNEDKSEMGERRWGASMTLEVKQDKENLTVVRVRIGRDGQERRMESVYSLDGKETTNGEGNRSSVSTAKWSEEGKSLTIHTKRTFTRDGQTMEFESDETWTLGEGGKVLTIQSKMSSSRGEFSTKLVYDLNE